MTAWAEGLLRVAARLRERNPTGECPWMGRTGEHNWVSARHWLRRFQVCVSCGRVDGPVQVSA